MEASKTEAKTPSFFKRIQTLANEPKTRTAASYAAAVLIFALTFCITALYIFFSSQGEFHADCVDTISWANASHEGDGILSSSFNYACFLPFSMTLIFQPLISLFGFSMTAQHIGMFIFFLLLTGFMFLCMREMKIDLRKDLLAVSVFLCFTLSSEKTREMFYQHTIYYSLGVLFIFIGLYLLFHLANLGQRLKAAPSQKLKIRYWVTFGALFVFVMLSATDGISGLSIFALPFIAGMCAAQLLDVNTRALGKSSLLVYLRAVMLFIAVFFGLKLLALLQGDMAASYADAYSNFAPKDDWLPNFQKLPAAWLSMFGVRDIGGTKMTDPESIFNLIRILGAAIFAVIPVAALVFYKKLSKPMQIMLWVHWAVSAVILLGYIFGGLSSADWRLIPMQSTAAAVSAMFLMQGVSFKKMPGRVCVLMTAAVTAFSFTSLKDTAAMKLDNYKENILFSISDYLEESGLTYGYGTYWNANAVTLISDSKVKMRDVMIDPNSGLKAGYLNCDKNWYKDQPGQDEYFLFLGDGEYQDLINSPGAVMLTQTTRTLDPIISGVAYHILVFDHNIM